MIVKIRDITESDPVYFETIEFYQIDDLIEFVERTGGVYSSKASTELPFHSYQIVLDGSEVFAEIIVGKDEE